MSKKFKVIVNTGNPDNNQNVEVTQGQGGRGQPVRLKAKAGAKYQLLDLEKAQAVGPDYVKVKRVGKHLHILFEESTEADVIIEDYYEVMPEGYNGVVGQAENGNFYEYIPEDPDVKGLIPQLADGGQAVSVALGGAEVAGSGAAVALLAAFNPLLAGLGLLGAGAAAAAAGAAGGGGAANTAATVSITAISTDTGTSTSDFITSDQTLSYSGTVSNFTANGAAVQLVLTDATGAEVGRTFVTPAANGTWTWDNTGVTRASGNYTLTATVVDAAGNRTNTAAAGQDTQLVTIDISGSNNNGGNNGNGSNGGSTEEANTAATVSITAISTDTGTSTSDFITSDPTLSYSGTVSNFTANGAAVQLVLTNASGTEVGRTFVTPATDGTWTWDNTGVSRASGNYTLTATVVDAAGNRTNTAAAGQDTQLVTIDISGSNNNGGNNGNGSNGGSTEEANTAATVSITAISTDTGC